MKARNILGTAVVLLFTIMLIIGAYLSSVNPYPGVFYGTAPPLPRAVAGVANNGDFYINVQNYTIYQFESEVWTETSNVPPNTDNSPYGLYIDMFIIGFIGAIVTIMALAWNQKR